MYSDGPGNRTPSLSGHHQQSLCFPFVLCRTVPDSFFSSDLSLPNQFMQNHIHELAKSLPVPPPAPRKQNTACDACRSVDRLMFRPFFFLMHVVRSRKVRCNRIPGQDKVLHTTPPFILQSSTHCLWASYSVRLVLTSLPSLIPWLAWQHCTSKNYPCTSVATWATLTFIVLTLRRPCRHFVQQATSEKKRMTVNRRRNLSSAGSRWVLCYQSCSFHFPGWTSLSVLILETIVHHHTLLLANSMPLDFNHSNRHISYPF